MFRVKYPLAPLLLSLLLLPFACGADKKTGSEVLISFRGGEITSAQVEKRAGEHLKRLRKKESEIIQRVAMELLIEELSRREGKGRPESPGTVNGAKGGAAGEKSPGKEADLSDEELRALFSKYGVKIFPAKPE